MTSTAHETPPVTSTSLLSKSSLVDRAAADISAAAIASRNDENARWYYYLTPNAVKSLPQYQYDGEDQSLLYKYILSPLAAWCVDNLTPAWLAPNAITLLGLCLMVFSYLLIWYWCPGTYEANTDLDIATSSYSVPAVIFLLNGCAMLIYQTLDNMDGKQARKTGSSSPLGLLFDHGCDALNSLLGSANWIAAMAMVPGNVSDLLGNNDHDNIQSKSLLSEFFGGDVVIACVLILFPMVAFYTTTWEQYYTGKLVLPPFNGPSEGLFMGAALSIISFVWGPMFWQGTSVADGAIDKLESYMDEGDTILSFFTPMQGRVRNMDLIVLASFIGLTREVAQKIIFVVRTHGLQTLRTAVPNFLLVASTLAMVHFDPTLLLRRPRVMMHLISGLFTEQTGQLMLDHMVQEDFEIFKRWTLFPYVFLAAGMMMGWSFSVVALDAFFFVYTTMLWIYLAFKIRVVIYEICDVLSIYCFDIVTPHPKKLSEVGGEVISGTTVPAVVDGTVKKTN
eukprot:CAMPEP_0172302154 /NCGR_PEP_ID=MMETSP1058-20130122/3895_1 /TAXON_ID=83371 /ORGANISM="Detonula confervacea, Strain CCMP 353" /LENGTH=506 /DNA_ID=CAMNT_0013012533 /DNA_START=136 /DNA_END=1656 /DNA_ORIENTATION=+